MVLQLKQRYYCFKTDTLVAQMNEKQRDLFDRVMHDFRSVCGILAPWAYSEWPKACYCAAGDILSGDTKELIKNLRLIEEVLNCGRFNDMMMCCPGGEDAAREWFGDLEGMLVDGDDDDDDEIWTIAEA